jgi:ubiquinone/menaquinone biosynthesis C-methylase UbiE
MPKEEVRRHFEAIAGDYDRWKERASYYYDLLINIYREVVPPGAGILEIGCGTGTLLSRLAPSRGVGIDISPAMVAIAREKHPGLIFRVADAEEFDPGETFDFVIVPDVVEHLADPEAMLRAARRCCRPDTRVIVTSVNPLWAPVLHVAERLGLKMPEGEHRWLPERALASLAREAGFTVSASYGRILCPKRVPLLAAPLNRAAARFRFLAPFCLTQVMVLAPRIDGSLHDPGRYQSGGAARGEKSET